MQYNRCNACTKSQRRYGRLNFSTNNVDFANRSLVFSCSCQSPKVYFDEDDEDDEDYSEEECSIVMHSCSFCDQAFDTATELYFHTDNAHTMANSFDNWDFYSMVGNSIIGNLDNFYYDQCKLNKLSDLIDALQTNVDKMKTITPMED
ncbi:uncharacterized protein EV154DRAFT_568042 [Mucor mucedo]|uniref:uncharacterized protein n=1 Tax=Mucor mucedo TaxID=29922 RepID=UPI0022205240|nr:uncharacterized protein EV154DRAFT_568042 [Mucor mucedo]KAI7883853.1 hypothetical protein EV154DRAFT_568042 [Mucor mucedo]